MSDDRSRQRLCVFCRAPITKQTVSREDTVPKWLQAELGIANERVEPTLTAPSGEQLKQRVHPVDQLLTGGVCRSCNNGWMSQLESAVMPILRPLIGSTRSVASLTRAERHVLSRWAVKTAFMLDLGGMESRVSLTHVADLYANAPHLPQGVYVFARQQARSRSWYYIESAWWKHAELENEALERVKRESYKIAMQFGDLMLFVVYWPLANWGLRIEANELFKLWPPAAIAKQFEHPEPQDVTASEDACIRYVTTISVVPHRGAEGFVHTKRRLTLRSS